MNAFLRVVMIVLAVAGVAVGRWDVAATLVGIAVLLRLEDTGRPCRRGGRHHG